MNLSEFHRFRIPEVTTALSAAKPITKVTFGLLLVTAWNLAALIPVIVIITALFPEQENTNFQSCVSISTPRFEKQWIEANEHGGSGPGPEGNWVLVLTVNIPNSAIWTPTKTVTSFHLEFGICFPVENNFSTKEMKVIPCIHIELDSFQSTFSTSFIWFSSQPCEVNTSDVTALLWELRTVGPRKWKELCQMLTATRC